MTEEDVKKEQIKIILINIIICMISFAGISFCFFIGYPQYPLGLLFGTIVCSIYHWLLYVFSGKLLKQGSDVKKKVYFYYGIRLLIFAFGLTICFVLEYFNIKYLSWITYLIPYLFLYIVILLTMKK